MKIFEQGYKVNFVDKNNVFVGYDLETRCCEDAGYFISSEIESYHYDIDCSNKFVINEYMFDQDFFQKVESEDLDAGGQVVFKIVCENKPDLYLSIFNAHNGWYSHGFKFGVEDKVLRDGYL